MYERRYYIYTVLTKAENFNDFVYNCSNNEDNVLMFAFVFSSVH